MKKNRTKHSPEFKAKVALGGDPREGDGAGNGEAVRLHPNLIYKWKRELRERVARVLNGGAATRRAGERSC